MTDAHNPAQIEFIRLAGHAVRVTSWSADERTGTFRLVTISRGSRDAELLDELFRQQSVTLELPGQPAIDVGAGDVDRREFGEGQSAITRFDVQLTVRDHSANTVPEPPDRSLEDRVSALEVDVIELRKLVSRLVNDR